MLPSLRVTSLKWIPILSLALFGIAALTQVREAPARRAQEVERDRLRRGGVDGGLSEDQLREVERGFGIGPQKSAEERLEDFLKSLSDTTAMPPTRLNGLSDRYGRRKGTGLGPFEPDYLKGMRDYLKDHPQGKIPIDLPPGLRESDGKVDWLKYFDATGSSAKGDSNPGSLLSPRSTFAGHGAVAAPTSLAPPMRHIVWKKTSEASGAIHYEAWEVDETTGGPARFVTTDELDKIYRTGAAVVNSGEVPHGPRWRAFTAARPGKTVIHEEGSANSNWQAIREASELSTQRLDPTSTKVFNALPQETDDQASRQELGRMGGIAGTREAWRAVNERIRASAGEIESHVANKEELLYELKHGNASMVVIYAHFDGERLYLPGAHGTTLSVAEIAGIDRTGDSAVRHRVIVLAACGTAAIPAGKSAESLVQVLLRKGIARSVFATDRPYDARDIPALITRLRSEPLRDAADKLSPHVEIEWPQGLHDLFREEALRREVTFIE